MKTISFAILLCFTIASCSQPTNESPTEETSQPKDSLKTENIPTSILDSAESLIMNDKFEEAKLLLEKEYPDAKNKDTARMKQLIVKCNNSLTPKPLSENDSLQLSIIGEHNLTLQWIGWNKPGKAVIRIENNKLVVSGEQRDKKTGDYLTISGEIEVVNAKELSFNGKIENRVSYVNNGKPCQKKGKFVFKATKGRKFWRLQQMDNCEQGGVVDYVDIYF